MHDRRFQGPRSGRRWASRRVIGRGCGRSHLRTSAAARRMGSASSGLPMCGEQRHRPHPGSAVECRDASAVAPPIRSQARLVRRSDRRASASGRAGRRPAPRRPSTAGGARRCIRRCDRASPHASLAANSAETSRQRPAPTARPLRHVQCARAPRQARRVSTRQATQRDAWSSTCDGTCRRRPGVRPSRRAGSRDCGPRARSPRRSARMPIAAAASPGTPVSCRRAGVPVRARVRLSLLNRPEVRSRRCRSRLRLHRARPSGCRADLDGSRRSRSATCPRLHQSGCATHRGRSHALGAAWASEVQLSAVAATPQRFVRFGPARSRIEREVEPRDARIPCVPFAGPVGRPGRSSSRRRRPGPPRPECSRRRIDASRPGDRQV